MTNGDIENIPLADLSESTKQLLLIFQHDYTKYLMRDDAFEPSDRFAIIAEICKFPESFTMCPEPIIVEAGRMLKTSENTPFVDDIHSEIYRLSLRIEDRRTPFFKIVN